MDYAKPLPTEIMKKAVKGISYISHPLRLRILEYLDVNGQASVSAITKALGAEQAIVSQSLKKCARTAWLKRQDAAYLFITTFVKNIRQAFLSACANYMHI